MSSEQLAALFERRLGVITGKGGTGRTTLAVTLAVLAARRGRRVLLCEIRGRDRAARLLGHAPIGDAIRELRPGLFVTNVTPEASLEEYVSGVLRSKKLYRLLFGGRAVSTFVNALPGLDDLMMIGKVRFHAEELAPGGAPRWDLVLVDAPATGNGLLFLDLPEVLLRVVGSGPLAFYARKQWALLRDPERTAVHIVTLAEEMPVAESVALARALRERLRMPLGALVVNRVRPRRLDARSTERLPDLGDLGGDPGADPEFAALAAAGRWAAGRDALQTRYLDELARRLPMPTLRLPELAPATPEPAGIDQLADALEAQLGPAGASR